MDYNIFDSLLECIDYLDSTQDDALATKRDVIDSMKMRMSIMIGRSMLHSPSFIQPVSGWKLEHSTRWE